VIVRAKSSLILVGLLLILLPVLAVLQYRWIGEVSAAERDRLESSLRVASERFAVDFNSEFSRLANAFQFREGFPDDASSVMDRYQAWAEGNAFSRIVRDVYLWKIGPGAANEFYRVDRNARLLQPTALPEAWEQIRERFRAGPGRAAAGDTMAVVLPIFRGGGRPFGPPRDDFRPPPRPDERRRRNEGPRPEREGLGPEPGPGPGGPGPIEGATIIELDRDAILNELVPALHEKHFSSHDETAYRIAIIAESETMKVLYSSDGVWSAQDIDMPDAEADLLAPPRGGPGGRGGGRGQGFRAQASLVGLPWRLLVKHRAGSLEHAVEQVRRRNLATAFGILLVLGAGLITVVVSSQRAHTLGKLQMEFAAGVSHELRTPLAVIRTAAYNLRSGIVRDKEGVEEYAQIVQEEARRLSDMVEEVLLYSETQSGRKKYKLESIDINEIIDRALSNLSPAFDLQQCDLSTHIDQDLPPVKADAAALTQCLQNLLSNAFKYGKTGDRAKIEIAARADTEAKEVRLSVTDHGSGIDSADRRQLFEPFYRGRNVGSNVPGNGLGLHLVKRIMQAQGGRVTYSPAPHGGATFTLHIPAAS